jgi:RNA polymerase sigma-70 factor (ECF subfamily)
MDGLALVLAAALQGGTRLDDPELRALRALYDACAGKILALALRLLRDRAEAEDVVQETFLEVWRRSSEYDPARASREGWAIMIGRSRALDRLRARASAARAITAEAAEPREEGAPPPLESVAAQEERVRVRDALARLPAEQRAVLELAWFDGLTHAEISSQTGHPLGTVKTRLRLGMEKLSAALARTSGEGTA